MKRYCLILAALFVSLSDAAAQSGIVRYNFDFVDESGPPGTGNFSFEECPDIIIAGCPELVFEVSFGSDPALIFDIVHLGGTAEFLRDFFLGNSNDAGTNFDSGDGLNLLSFESPGVYCLRLNVGASGLCADDPGVFGSGTWSISPLPITIAIDIKPGSDPNCFNINGHGVVPVAILGSEDFDPGEIDTSTLFFAGFEVRIRGNRGPLCGLEYANDDDLLDLVCHFDDSADNWTLGDGEATLTGELYDGTKFEGTDSICIVPKRHKKRDRRARVSDDLFGE